MLNFISRMEYYVNNTEGGHGFKRGEIVRIIQMVSADTVIAINEEGKFWALNRNQLIPYKKYGTK